VGLAIQGGYAERRTEVRIADDRNTGLERLLTQVPVPRVLGLPMGSYVKTAGLTFRTTIPDYYLPCCNSTAIFRPYQWLLSHRVAQQKPGERQLVNDADVPSLTAGPDSSPWGSQPL